MSDSEYVIISIPLHTRINPCKHLWLISAKADDVETCILTLSIDPTDIIHGVAYVFIAHKVAACVTCISFTSSRLKSWHA